MHPHEGNPFFRVGTAASVRGDGGSVGLAAAPLESGAAPSDIGNHECSPSPSLQQQQHTTSQELSQALVAEQVQPSSIGYALRSLLPCLLACAHTRSAALRLALRYVWIRDKHDAQSKPDMPCSDP